MKVKNPGRFKAAFNGLLACFKYERNMKIHAVMAFAAIGLAVYLNLTDLEFTLVLIIIALVFAVEMINTAVEKTVDLITAEYSELARFIKDAAAGAVLVMALLSIAAGYFLFFKKIFP